MRTTSVTNIPYEHNSQCSSLSHYLSTHIPTAHIPKFPFPLYLPEYNQYSNSSFQTQFSHSNASFSKRARSPFESPASVYPGNKRQCPTQQPLPFRASAGTSSSPSASLSACAVCLGRHQHQVAMCNATKIWDGSRSMHCHRNANRCLINGSGKLVCINFQLRPGCKLVHKYLHECSGCGSPAHGVNGCHYAQSQSN